MLSEEQVKKLISANESLQVQLDDLNAILASREQEIAILIAELDDTTALRSKLDGQQATGAGERAFELHQELSEISSLNKQYNDLLQDYAYLQSRYKDVQAQLTAMSERNFELQQIAGKVGELQSSLENSLLEKEDLKSRIAELESQKYAKEFNL